MHRAAVMAEKELELRDQRGELTHGQNFVQDDEVRPGEGADLLDERLLVGAGNEKDLRTEFILQPVADGGKGTF